MTLETTVIRECLYRVFDEKTGITTFLVLSFQGESIAHIVGSALVREREFNEEKNGFVYLFVAADMAGSFQDWITKVLTPEDRARRRES